ncbi:MAG: sigma-70 family RNA polymerase sigma factor [Planctomycetota bacterium]
MAVEPDSGQLENRRRELARQWVTVQPTVSAYIWSCVPDFHAAEDLLQDVAEDVASSFDRYDADRPFVGWVLGIARFKVIDYYRKNDRDRHVFQGESLERLVAAFETVFPEIDPKREALEHCIEKLQAKSRRALELRYEQDMKPAQIADVIGSTPGSVRVTLTRIRTALSKCIETRLSQKGGGRA